MPQVALLSPPSDASVRLPPAPRVSINLLDLPANTTFQIWRKPLTGFDPVDEGSVHVSELIHGDGDHVLTCFASMTPGDWENIQRELVIGEQLMLRPLLVVSLDRSQIGCGLWGAKRLAGLHGVTREPSRPTVFVPSLPLMKILNIQIQGRGSTRNALILIRQGRVIATWISGGEGDCPHDWTAILSMV